MKLPKCSICRTPTELVICYCQKKKQRGNIFVEIAESITPSLTNMNELLTFFYKGLIIAFLIILGLFLLRKMSKILASLFFLWIILAILAFLVLPLIALTWAIVYLAK